jgi:hypothetical protein
MGVCLNIYLDIDQNTITKYIDDNNLDKSNYIDNTTISNHFFPDLDVSCYYDEDLDIYKIYVSYGINFIRDNKKFNDIVYHKILEKKHCKKFRCSYFDIRGMSNKEDIINIIAEIRFWFSDEEDFICFSNFLEKILKYEIIYIDID